MIQLKTLREGKGLNMRETAKLLGMPYTTYVNYEKGLREPTSEILIQLADFYGITIDFLLGRPSGDIEAIKKTIIQLSTTSVPSSLELSKDEANLIIKYRCLDERGKSAVLNTLNHEYESLPGEKANPPAKNA